MNQNFSATMVLQALPPYGINRESLRHLLRDTGCTVRHVRRTGEVAYSRPAVLERPRANGRRKDATAHLVWFVRRIIQAREFILRGEQVARFPQGR